MQLDNFSFLQTSKSKTNNLTTMKAVALMVFLLLFLASLLAHADHLVTQNTVTEQQDCQLCNQGIDTPPIFPQVIATFVTRYNNFTTKIFTVEFTLSQFVQPLLRAPPLIQ